LSLLDLRERFSRLLTLRTGRRYSRAMERRVNSAPRAGIQFARKKQILIFVNPEEPSLHSFLALSYFYQKKLKPASGEIEKGLQTQTAGPFPHAVLAMIQAASGRPDSALSEVTLRVEPYTEGDASLCSAAAAVYSLLGRNGLAIQWLEKAVSLGYEDFVWLSNDPNFDRMRNDPRFIGVLERVKEKWEKSRKG